MGKETSVQKQRTMRRNCACYVVPSITSYKQTNTFTHNTEIQFQRFHKAKKLCTVLHTYIVVHVSYIHTHIYTSTKFESNSPQTVQHAHTCMQACTPPPFTHYMQSLYTYKTPCIRYKQGPSLAASPYFVVSRPEVEEKCSCLAQMLTNRDQ